MAEPGRLRSMESQRVRHDWVTSRWRCCNVPKALFLILEKLMSSQSRSLRKKAKKAWAAARVTSPLLSAANLEFCSPDGVWPWHRPTAGGPWGPDLREIFQPSNSCVWVSSGSWWCTGKPGMLQFIGSQRVRHDWATELKWTGGPRASIS